MGFLDKLGDSLLGGIGDIISGGVSVQQAGQNREWQEKMSNTAYRRAVVDMKAAGLNPMLAYSQGGATTPSGGVPDIPNLGEGFRSSARTSAAVDQVESAIELNRAQKEKIEAETREIQNRTLGPETYSAKAGAEIQKLITDVEGIRSQIEKTGVDTAQGRVALESAQRYLRAMVSARGFEAQAAMHKLQNDLAKANISFTDVQKIVKQIQGVGESWRSVGAQYDVEGKIIGNQLELLKIPGGESEAKFKSSPLGKESAGIQWIGDLIGNLLKAGNPLRR